jgi:ATP-binding cassette subfamily B (MDR/TAP) protein 1
MSAVYIVKEDKDTNPGDAFMSLFVIMFGASHAGTAAAMGPDMGKATVALDRIFKFIRYPSSINAIEMDKDTTKKRLDLNNVKGMIEFKDVWFRYPSRKEEFVIRGMNITINPGDSVALVGESGCGKSTFVNLMMRFYDPDHGQILFDDVDIREINLHDLRTAISLVMQEPIIFNYTILENILYGKLDATNSEVLEAAELSNCTEFIVSKN